MKTRLPFSVLDNAVSPADIIKIEMDRLEQKLDREYGIIARKPGRLTKVSVYPKQAGESINCLDPLVPREGIEIEIRAYA
jgi:hypothetical protein